MFNARELCTLKNNKEQQESPATSSYRWTPRTLIAGITFNLLFLYQNVATYPTTSSATTSLCTLHSPNSTSFHPRSSQGYPASAAVSTTTTTTTTTSSTREWLECAASGYGRLDKRLGSSCKNSRIEVRVWLMFISLWRPVFSILPIPWFSSLLRSLL